MLCAILTPGSSVAGLPLTVAVLTWSYQIKIKAMRRDALLLASIAAVLGVVITSATSQQERPPCSLNGVLDPTTGTCICHLPWKGKDCGVLDELPVSFPQGYGMMPNRSATWGGGILYDPSTSLFHLYVSAMTNHCPLQNFRTNSRIEHATSHWPTGPFSFQDVAVSTFAHNPHPIQIYDCLYAMFHIGSGSGPPNGGINCTTATTKSTQVRRDRRTRAGLGDGGSTIHISHSPAGPWTPLGNNTLPNCNNPSPYIHPSNASIFVVCNEDRLYRSDSGLVGPWALVTTIPTGIGPAGNYEDPFLWIDTDTEYFHVLFHVYRTDERDHGNNCTDTMISAHAFSTDGLQWYFGDDQPYTSQVKVYSNEGVLHRTLSTRERPFLLFDSAQRRPTHLVTAVCGAPNCPGGPPTGCVDCKGAHWDFTLVVPLLPDPTVRTPSLYGGVPFKKGEAVNVP